MKIIIVKDAGYCFGVRDAVHKAFDSAKKYGTVYMLGDIVHNEQVVDDLSKSGVKVVQKLADIPDNSPVLFRAHGTVNELWDQAREKNMTIIDATCPLVYEIHREVKKLADENRKIIIIGDHKHDEVFAIADQAKNTTVISNVEEAKKLPKIKSAGVVIQSTQTIENVQNIINVLLEKVFDLRFINTICYPTKRNQNQIKELSIKTDVMIIIGSFTSANSKRLTKLALEKNSRSYQVTCAAEMKSEWFKDAQTVGISAGASTPDYLIEEVKNKLKSKNWN